MNTTAATDFAMGLSMIQTHAAMDILSSLSSAEVMDPNEQAFDYMDSSSITDGVSGSGISTTIDNRLHLLEYAQNTNNNNLSTITTNTSDTISPLDPVLIERFTRNRSIDGPWYHVLILLYSVLIIFGALGNILVVIAVVRKPIMRTARNLFILNLAISGELLLIIENIQ